MMTESILSLIKEWGISGVFISLFIEGSALPFIGSFIMVTVGFILDLTWFEMIWISIAGSFLYAIGSWIPYFIGYKFGKSVENRLSDAKRAKLTKAKKAFSKNGVWSVAISSPLHLGNFVPFLAGMSHMKLRTYTLLTMIGIAPSTFLFLSIGHFYPGDFRNVMNTVTDYQLLLFILFALITLFYMGIKFLGYRQQKKLMKQDVMS
ncbi:VTT domain-containing protein [Neobacillus sp. YX16]|uniref:DedA family protein n=1 Tax=Neobacillus sp. YX16 TaxID=3047874 RepID=UPI0024C3754B|nr:VTT domain-containing protein [Neobacillus sp. YX16]WHZ00702.1 VTT domain-containing protein [Neobacillus sp. YX16]